MNLLTVTIHHFISNVNLTLLGMLPIHWAASDGKIASLTFLLDKRRNDINKQDSSGSTPVIIAAQHNQIDCVAYLIKNGADLSIKDRNGDGILHWAAYKGYTQMAGLITYLTTTELENEDVYGQAPVHLAALRGNVETLEYLILNCGAQ